MNDIKASQYLKGLVMAVQAVTRSVKLDTLSVSCSSQVKCGHQRAVFDPLCEANERNGNMEWNGQFRSDAWERRQQMSILYLLYIGSSVTYSL